MKYLLTVFVIVVAVSIGTVLFLLPEPDKIEGDVLVTVNGHDLPTSLLEQKREQGGYHSKEDKAILDNIIINELLLQEAQARGIDKEPQFRVAVQNYYEQSLIKILIDRQFVDMAIEATDEDVDKYISNFGSIFTFTRLYADDSGDSGRTSEQRSVLFDDLSDSLKLMLGGMEIGDTVTDYYTGNEVVSFRLDSIDPDPSQESYPHNREAIKMIITNHKKERALTSWIKELRDKATITSPDNAGKS